MASQPLSAYKFSPNVKSGPLEQAKPGDVLHSRKAEIAHISVDDVYELAKTGLGHTLIAAKLGISYPTLMDNFKTTLERARADRAVELWYRLWDKAEDQSVMGDMAAIKMLLNRLDPEPKEPIVQVNVSTQAPPQLLELNPDDLNNLIIQAETK